MKAILLSLFIALLMFGCGESSPPADPVDPVDLLDSLKATDFDDPETVGKVLAEATLILEYREKNGETLSYGVDEQTPYSGWEKAMHSNGQAKALLQYKDGKPDGLSFYWHSNGQKEKELNYKDGKLMSAVVWKPNEQKCPVTNVKNGNGVRVVYNADGFKSWERNFKDGKQDGLETGWYRNGQKSEQANYKDRKKDGPATYWYESGQKRKETIWKDGKLMSAVHWKPNGEKCPVTNLKDGNGVGVDYNEDGTQLVRRTYKDGLVIRAVYP